MCMSLLVLSLYIIIHWYSWCLQPYYSCWNTPSGWLSHIFYHVISCCIQYTTAFPPATWVWVNISNHRNLMIRSTNDQDLWVLGPHFVRFVTRINISSVPAKTGALAGRLSPRRPPQVTVRFQSKGQIAHGKKSRTCQHVFFNRKVMESLELENPFNHHFGAWGFSGFKLCCPHWLSSVRRRAGRHLGTPTSPGAWIPISALKRCWDVPS